MPLEKHGPTGKASGRLLHNCNKLLMTSIQGFRFRQEHCTESGFGFHMREIFEFRVVEEFANRLFSDNEGKKLGSGLIRLVRIPSYDPRLVQIGKFQEEIHHEL